MKISPVKLALGAVGLGVGVVATFALREATLSTHTEVDARETEMVMSADTKSGESDQTLSEMVEAQVQACRLEVTSDLTEPIESLGDDRFRAVLTPAMDETNRRQFRGCMEDWMIDHVRINVVELANVD